MAVIDVHTHMLTEEYLAFLGEHGGPKYERKPTQAGQDTIWMHGAPFMTLMPEMWDYDARIRDMDLGGFFTSKTISITYSVANDGKGMQAGLERTGLSDSLP